MQENELNKLRESLVGATLREFRVEQGEQSLAILADRGVIVLITDADCCSETWFADLLGVSNVLGKEVYQVDALDLPDPEDERSRQESDRAYGLRLTTPGGVCDIVYRNSSNGYYGGSAEVLDRDVDTAAWRVVTDDWQA